MPVGTAAAAAAAACGWLLLQRPAQRVAALERIN